MNLEVKAGFCYSGAIRIGGAFEPFLIHGAVAGRDVGSHNDLSKFLEVSKGNGGRRFRARGFGRCRLANLARSLWEQYRKEQYVVIVNAASRADMSREVLEELNSKWPGDAHPVLDELRRSLAFGSMMSWNWIVEKAVIRYGRKFVGVARPKGHRRGRARACFANAERTAGQGKGVYVEGLALSPIGGGLVYHGWVTTNGEDAIEVTWKHDATVCHYFGIPFSTSLRAKWLAKLRYWGFLDVPPEYQDELLRDLGADLSATVIDAVDPSHSDFVDRL